MEEMVLKYSREFPDHCGTVDTPKTEAILVTGTTGALGCYIIAHLLTLPEISVVYAFNRTGGSIEERQRTAFVNNGIDEQLLMSPKLRLLEGSLSQPAFGLASDDYDEMREKVTCIIQNGGYCLVLDGVCGTDLAENSVAGGLQHVAIFHGAFRRRVTKLG